MLGGGEATGNAADHGVGGGSGDGRKLQIMLPMSPVKASMTAASDFRRMGTSSATTIEVWSDEVAALGTRKHSSGDQREVLLGDLEEAEAKCSAPVGLVLDERESVDEWPNWNLGRLTIRNAPPPRFEARSLSHLSRRCIEKLADRHKSLAGRRLAQFLFRRVVGDPIAFGGALRWPGFAMAKLGKAALNSC